MNSTFSPQPLSTEIGQLSTEKPEFSTGASITRGRGYGIKAFKALLLEKAFELELTATLPATKGTAS